MYYFLARPPSLAYRRALVECTRQYTAVPPQAVTREKKKEILCTPTTLRPTRLLCAYKSLARRRSPVAPFVGYKRLYTAAAV